MAAVITWVCHVVHSFQDRSEHPPLVTLHERKWAYCPQGGDRDHKWDAIEPAPYEAIRTRGLIHESASSRARAQ